MKKLISITAAAVMLFAGCSRNEVIVPTTQEKGSQITFGTYVGRSPQTKGTSMDLGILKENDFGVFAFYENNKSWEDYSSDFKMTPGFMYNVRVYWAGDKSQEVSDGISSNWKYDNLKYWPEDGDASTEINFFAYAPYKESTTWTGETGSIAFTLADDVADLEDLVYSATPATYWKDVQTELNASSNNIAPIQKADGSVEHRVKIEFQHALSRIGFSAKVDAPYLEVAITEITVGGEVQGAESMIRPGDMAEMVDESGEPDGTGEPDGSEESDEPVIIYHGFYKSGNFKLAEARKVEETVSPQEEITDPDTGADTDPAPVEPDNYWDVEGSETTAIFTLDAENLNENAADITEVYKPVNKDDSYLFVIPQKFEQNMLAQANQTNQGILQADENGLQADNNGAEKIESSFSLPITVKYTVRDKRNENEEAVSYEGYSFITHTFHQGKAYTIQINLTGSIGLDAVKFAVVDDFDWGTEKDVDAGLIHYQNAE